VGLATGDLVGFRIVGDAATPLGTGILVMDSAISFVDVEVTGAAIAAVVFAEAGRSSALVGSHIHDNSGVGLVVDAGASPRITSTVFSRNGTADRALEDIRIHPNAKPTFLRNTFIGVTPRAFDGVAESVRRALLQDNWFLSHPNATPAPTADARAGRR
jgi:hypothetical protein